MPTPPRGRASARSVIIAILAGAAALVLPSTLRVGRTNALDAFYSKRVPPAAGPNIVVITVDTLRADHVGLYGYHRPTTPAIDAFFSEGRIFDVTYAPTATTTPSIVSMFTGYYPPRHRVRLLCQKLSPSVITVVDHLRRAGYQAAAVVSNAVLADSASGLANRFDHYDDRVDEPEPFREGMFERRADRTTDAAIHWLTVQRRDDRRFFLWIHYIDPHGPYRPPDDKPADFTHDEPISIDPQRVPAYAREPGLYDGNEYVDRYDEEIAYTDREVGRLLAALETLGLAERTAFILTSDHGESMMDHEHWFRHEMNVYEEMVRVPLVLRYPEVSPARIDDPVSLIDVAPTIAELAGLPPLKGVDGKSLLGDLPERDILCEGRAEGGGLWRGLVRGRVKTCVRHGMSNVIREARRFDLSTDPKELRPQPVGSDDPVWKLLDRLIRNDPDRGGVPQQYAEGELPAPNVAPGVDPKMHRHLRSLGYVGD